MSGQRALKLGTEVEWESQENSWQQFPGSRQQGRWSLGPASGKETFLNGRSTTSLRAVSTTVCCAPHHAGPHPLEPLLRGCPALEIVCAHDLNGFKEFEHSASVDSIMAEAKMCQSERHNWGRATESTHIVSHAQPHGDSFKLLSVPSDCKLRMDMAVSEGVPVS